MARLGVPSNAFHIDGASFTGKVSFLKLALPLPLRSARQHHLCARDHHGEFGCGLDELLRVRLDEGRLTGIINGIDPSWDPAAATALRAPSTPGSAARSATPNKCAPTSGRRLPWAFLRSRLAPGASEGSGPDDRSCRSCDRAAARSRSWVRASRRWSASSARWPGAIRATFRSNSDSTRWKHVACSPAATS